MTITMSKSLLFAFMGCLLAASSAASAGPKIEHWVAPSGARVYFIETHTVPILDVQMDFAAGGAHVPAAKAGLAGLTVGMLDSGSIDLNEEQIAVRWVDLGAQFRGSADQDRASVGLRTLSSPAQRDGALELMRTVLATPTFPQAALDREKLRSIAAIREAETQPESIAAKRFTALMYPGHPYGVSLTTESVANVGRDDLVAFHRAGYAARNASVSIVGDVSRQKAMSIAQRLTDALPAGDSSNALLLPAVTLPARTIEKIPHPATQSHIYIGVPALRRGDPDYFPLLVGNYTLGGGGFISRLVNEVRERRGLAYDVSSGFSAHRLEGPFEINLQTRRDQADEALAVVNDVVGKFISGGPTTRELAAAKKHLIDGFALRLDSNLKLLGHLSVIGFYERPLTYLDDFSARVNAVTARQIKQAFARHVPLDHLVTVIVAAD